MVQISNILVIAFLLAAPSLAIPIAKEQGLQAHEVDIEARDPSFGSFFRKISRKVRKFVNPSNIGKVASVASLVIRDEYPEFSERDLEYIQDLAARDPSIGSFFRKVKNFFSPSHIDKAANTVKEASKLASMLRREDTSNLSERSFNQDIEELTARDFEDLEELAARDPKFGSFFRKIKHFANFNNIKKVASVASMVIREDDGMFERGYSDLELDELD